MIRLRENKLTLLLLLFVLLNFNRFTFARSYTNLLIDNYTNNNFSQNNLGGYCEVYAYNGWSWGGEGDTWWDGSSRAGMISAFSNNFGETNFYFYYLSILPNQSGGYLNFNDDYNNFAIKVFMLNDNSGGKPDSFQLEKLQLKDNNNSLIGSVYFSNYNGGTNTVPDSSTEYVFPIQDFTNDGGNKNFTVVKSLIFFTSITQNCQFKLTDLMIVRGVEISEVSISNITQSSTNRFVAINDNLRVNVLERSNVYGCSGYIVLSNSLNNAKTNIPLSELKAGSDSSYYTNFFPAVSGKYYIDSVLTNKYAKDLNGINTNLWDTYFYAGIGIKSVDSFVSTDTDENYFVGQSIGFSVIESNGFNDLSGYIRITNAVFSTNISLTNYSGGEYRCIWDTTGLSDTNYYCEVRLDGDSDGANNSGVDLTIVLTNVPGGIKISSIDSSAGTDSTESYQVGSIVKFTVEESSGISGLTGKIIINSETSDYSNEIFLTSIGSGVYECEWNTAGLEAARDYEIESQLGSDTNGYNDSGADMIISLYQTGEVSFFSNNFYQKYLGEAYISIPEGALKDTDRTTIDIETVLIDVGNKVLYGNIYKFLPGNQQFAEVVKIGLPVPSTAGYALYTYNGFEWVKVNSALVIRGTQNYLETETYTTGIFAVFEASSAGIYKISVSRRVFSPNDDGVNDFINISIPGSVSEVTSIVVYDIAGREIRNLHNMLLWDGRDNNSRKVKSGVYIIKVSIGNKEYYKTVTVINK